MDPVALIVTALAAGAGSAVQDGASDAVKGAYTRLREAVCERLAGYPDGELALARHEAGRQAGQAPLAAVLARAGAGNDAGLAAAALAVMELLDGGGARAGKYAVPVTESQGVQVGDHNTQVSYIIGGYGDQWGGRRAAHHGVGYARSANVDESADSSSTA